MKKNILSLIVFALFLGIGITQASDISPQEKFEQANSLFESGETNRALEIYRELIRLGFSSDSLYYNLGNAFYRRGERGNAILWYLRAKNLAPRDSDITFNLSIAQSHIKNIRGPFLEKIVFYVTNKELGWIVTALTWIFFIFLSLVLSEKIQAEVWPAITLWTSGILLVLFSAWLGIHLTLGAKPWAVVRIPPGEVRNGPGNDYAVGFTVPEGSTILIMNKRPKWTQIGVPQEGLKGWILTDELEEINTIKVL